MKLRLIGGSGCGNGPCPAVYVTENNTLVVQGFVIDMLRAGIDLPPGEGAVEIPLYVLERALAAK